MTAAAAVIFDVDGVLLELTAEEEDAFFHPFERLHGLTGLSRDWDSYRVRNDENIIAEILEDHLGHPPTSDQKGAMIAAYLDHLRAQLDKGAMRTVMIEGSEALLRQLRGHGLAIGIATANLLGAARLRLEAAGLWDHVAALPFGADGGGTKSAILARAIAATGLPRDRIVYLGDNLNDVEAGRANGVKFIGFACEERRRRRLSAAGALAVCGDHVTSYQLICRMLAPALDSERIV